MDQQTTETPIYALIMLARLEGKRIKATARTKKQRRAQRAQFNREVSSYVAF